MHEIAHDEHRLHIAVVTETWLPEVNGVARTIAQMVRGALARGHAVELIRPRQTVDTHGASVPANWAEGADCVPLTHLSQQLVPGFPIPGYPGMRFGLPVRARLIARWRTQRPDVVQVVTEGPLGWAAVSAARALEIPVLSEFHTNFHSYSQHYSMGWCTALIARYLRYLHNRTATTLVPTQQLANELCAQGYRHVDVVARGIDRHVFKPSLRSEALRAQWGAAPHDVVLTYVGRLAAEKNPQLLVRAFRAIRTVQPSVKLVIVGDGPLRAELAQSLPEAVFAGMRHGTDLGAHYASADLFLFPSITETFGNVVTEALACGLPVMAYDYAAAHELIRPGDNGALAPVGDEDAYLKAALPLARRLAQPQEREHHAMSACEAVRELGWDRIHERMHTILRHCAHSPGMPPVLAAHTPHALELQS
jgi:glycosyltransferase involved in cell wall biosynthesis